MLFIDQKRFNSTNNENSLDFSFKPLSFFDIENKISSTKIVVSSYHDHLHSDFTAFWAVFNRYGLLDLYFPNFKAQEKLY
jgi:hypothetical protein